MQAFRALYQSIGCSSHSFQAFIHGGGQVEEKRTRVEGVIETQKRNREKQMIGPVENPVTLETQANWVQFALLPGIMVWRRAREKRGGEVC